MREYGCEPQTKTDQTRLNPTKPRPNPTKPRPNPTKLEQLRLNPIKLDETTPIFFHMLDHVREIVAKLRHAENKMIRILTSDGE